MRKLLIILYTVLLFISINTINVHAEEESNHGILQISYGYLFEDGSFDVWNSEIGVIVNTNTVFAYDISTIDYTELLYSKQNGYETLGITIEDARAGACYMIYNGKNSYIPVINKTPIVNEQGSFVLLKTTENLDNNISFSPHSALNDETIYALGFPADNIGTNSFASQDNILKQNIQITNEDDSFVTFSINSTENFRGSVLVNDYNEIYGFILRTDNGGTAYSVASLRNILDTNNIIYNVAPEILPVDFSRLHSVTDAAKDIDTVNDVYTEESVERFKKAYKAANDAGYNKEISQTEIDKVTKDLEDAIIELEKVPEDHTSLIIGLVIGGILLVIILIIVILCIKDKDLVYKLLGIKKKEVNTSVKGNVSSFIDDNTIIEGLEDKPSENEAVKKETKKAKPEKQVKHTAEPEKFSNNFQGGYIYEDRTSIPDSATPNTSVLKSDISSNDEITGVPYIIREKTKERFIITHNQFTIGRDTDVDYKLSDNLNISKTHCRFIETAGQWYIIDNKSSNKTLVNGNEAKPYESVPLYDKAEIILANERFIFRYITENPSANKKEVFSEEVYSSESSYDTNVLRAEDKPESIKIPYLIINGRTIKLQTFPFSIGRGKEATYKYTNNKNVSRKHIIITKENGQYYIRDNDSANGTFLNNEPLNKGEDYVLNDNARIQIMDDEFEFHI